MMMLLLPRGSDKSLYCISYAFLCKAIRNRRAKYIQYYVE
jgi:hypothetical protein